MAEKDLELLSMTLPAPPVHTAETAEHAAKRREHRRTIIGQDAFDKEQDMLDVPVQLGADPQESADLYEASLAYKSAVMEKTEVIMENSGTERRVPDTTESDADSGRDSGETESV